MYLIISCLCTVFYHMSYDMLKGLTSSEVCERHDGEALPSTRGALVAQR